MRKISLTQGQFALVDDEDYQWLNQWKWYAYKTPNGSYYSTRTVKDYYVIKTGISMHRQILDLDAGVLRKSKHINEDTLDNRRSNLKSVATRRGKLREMYGDSWLS